MILNCKFGIQLVRRTLNQLLVHTLEGFIISAIGALLVFDITSRDSFENVSKWLGEITANTSQNIVIALIGNKADLVSEFFK